MRLTSNNALESFREALTAGLRNQEDTTLIFYDLNILKLRLASVKEAFGSSFRHSVAIKSNPLAKVLARISSEGFGLEAASFEELYLANIQAAAFKVWDSPVKTSQEIKNADAMQGELLINADNLNELELICTNTSNANIGLRINPQLNTGSHASMSVAGQYSKFGEPITNREAIINAVKSFSTRINTLHVHSSSQTTDYAKLVEAVRSVIDLAIEINKESEGQITTIDIGGGFPVSYSEASDFDIQDYADQLKAKCPELWDGSFEGITEFGRYYHANAGFTATRIESVKGDSEHQTIITHAGADLFLREAYNPGVWPHEYSLVRNGETVGGSTLSTDIGGPLCFGGDYIQKEVPLTQCMPGDWLLIHDTGANSFALWSRHCSRPFPKVIGIADSIEVMKERESIESIMRFWT